MPDIKTRADSIRMRHTVGGGGSDGDAQSDPDASIGGHKSSTRADGLGTSGGTPSANMSLDYAAPANGTGDGTLEVVSADTVRWKAPGGSFGDTVTIANGESKVLEDGGDLSKFVIVSRTSTSDMTTGTSTVTLTQPVGSVFSLDRVTSTEASNGDLEYRAVALVNDNADGTTAESLRLFLLELGTEQTTDDNQLGSSGSGTIGTTGSFSDWPDTGYAQIRDSNGALRENVYYSSRTDTALTVPSAGRALLGTSAEAGASTDVVHAIPGIRIGTEAPASQPSGAIQNVADEDTAPTGISWQTPIDFANGIQAPDTGDGTEKLASGNWFGLWIEREVPAGAKADPDLLSKIRAEFDIT